MGLASTRAEEVLIEMPEWSSSGVATGVEDLVLASNFPRTRSLLILLVAAAVADDPWPGLLY